MDYAKDALLILAKYQIEVEAVALPVALSEIGFAQWEREREREIDR